MKAKQSITTIAAIMAISCTGINLVNSNHDVSALTYQTKINNNFTISPSVSISLSSADLIIDDLAPGSSSDSNIVTLTVESNNPYGYTVSSTVGNDDQYPNADLKHQDSTASKVVDSFTSLSTTDDISNLDNLTAGNWGYSYNLNNTNWSNYSGLPLYNSGSAKELYTTSANNNSTIDFKIAASAKPQQIAGEYNNVINFITTVTPKPDVFYMQEVNRWRAALGTETPVEAVDQRDGKTYQVAKLKDGNIWMTTNLSLASGEEIESTLSDVPDGYTLPVNNGFQENNLLPESSTDGFSDNQTAYSYNSNRDDPSYCSEAPGCYSYYSWVTATAGSGIGMSTINTDAPYSICPKNWRLPTARYSDPFDSTLAAQSETYKLAVAYGMSEGAWRENTDTFYNNAGPGTAPNFVLAGNYANSKFYSAGLYAFYWTSTVYSDSSNILFNLTRNRVFTIDYSNGTRNNGFSIRCLAR